MHVPSISRCAPLILVAAAACSSSSSGPSASSFCQNLCPAYITCANTPANGATPVPSPLFCTIDSESACETACQNTTAGLGDSESGFISCGNCVLQYGAATVCNEATAGKTGQVSCSNSCSSEGSASSSFYGSFTTALQTELTNEAKGGACTAGTKKWNASDKAVTPDNGNVQGTTWTITTGSGGLSVKNLTLPPGSYTAGFTDVTGQLHCGGNIWAQTPGSSPSMNLPSTLSGTQQVSFTLDDIAEGVSFGMDFSFCTTSNGLYATATVGGAFITRH